MKILVATDGSRGGSAAVRFGARLAASCRSAELVVITVGDLRQALFREGRRPSARVVSEIEKEDRRSSERVLARASREAARSGVRARCEYVEAKHLAPIAKTICRKADRERADLIAVGSEGRGAIGRWVFGSVVGRLVHVARRPVAVVHPPNRAPRR